MSTIINAKEAHKLTKIARDESDLYRAINYHIKKYAAKGFSDTLWFTVETDLGKESIDNVLSQYGKADYEAEWEYGDENECIYKKYILNIYVSWPDAIKNIKNNHDTDERVLKLSGISKYIYEIKASDKLRDFISSKITESAKTGVAFVLITDDDFNRFHCNNETISVIESELTNDGYWVENEDGFFNITWSESDTIDPD